MVWCQCCKNFSELRNSNKFQWNLNLMLIFDSILTCAWGKTFRSHDNLKFGRVSRMALPMNVQKRVRCTLVVSSIGFPNRIKCARNKLWIWIRWYRWLPSSHLHTFICDGTQTFVATKNIEREIFLFLSGRRWRNCINGLWINDGWQTLSSSRNTINDMVKCS